MEAREQMMLDASLPDSGSLMPTWDVVHGIAAYAERAFSPCSWHGKCHGASIRYGVQCRQLPAEDGGTCPGQIHLPVTGNVEEDKYLLSAELLETDQGTGHQDLVPAGN